MKRRLFLKGLGLLAGAVATGLKLDIPDLTFQNIPGFSKFGSYIGNGTSQTIDGLDFINCLGFVPDYMIIRDESQGGITIKYPVKSWDEDGFTLDGEGEYLGTFDSVRGKEKFPTVGE